MRSSEHDPLKKFAVSCNTVILLLLHPVAFSKQTFAYFSCVLFHRHETFIELTTILKKVHDIDIRLMEIEFISDDKDDEASKKS